MRAERTDYMASIIAQMERLRSDGRTWAEVAEETGYGSARCASSTYCRERRRFGLTPAGSGEAGNGSAP